MLASSCCILCTIIFLCGFAYFLIHTPNTTCTAPEVIVVLTGGNRRVEEGFKSLVQTGAKTILISGIGEGVSLSDFDKFQKQFNVDSSRIFLGGLSHDTVENAIETSAFMKLHNFTKACIVTSSYHIPRSHIIFQRNMPQHTIGFIPVTENFNRNKYSYVKKRLIEYTKFLFTFSKNIIDHTL